MIHSEWSSRFVRKGVNMVIHNVFSRVSRWSLVAFLVSVPLLVSTSAAADVQTPGTCRPVQLHVALGAGQPDSQTLSGTLCNPA